MATREFFPYCAMNLKEPKDGEGLAVYAPGVWSLGLGLTGRCNFNCPMCYYHGPSDVHKGKDLPLVMIKKILEGCGHLHTVNVSLEGEPLLHSQFFEALDVISEHAQVISLSTNGALLTKEKAKRLKAYRFAAFSLSVDADRDPFYSRFRGGGSFALFESIAALATEHLGGVVSINSVLFHQNLEHLTGIPSLAWRCGIRRISLMQLRSHEAARARGITPATDEELLPYLEMLAEQADKWGVALIFDPFFGNARVMEWLRGIHSDAIIVYSAPTGTPCVLPWRYASVLSDGRLFPCCGDYAPLDIDHYDFDGIFNHTAMRRLRASLLRGPLPQACRECHYLE